MPSPSARRDTIRRRAVARHPANDVEREIFEAVYAYEEAKTKLTGRRAHASYTWRAIDRHGAIAAVERIVCRKAETDAYRVLVEMGLKEMSFEAVVLRNKNAFTPSAIAASAARLLEQG